VSQCHDSYMLIEAPGSDVSEGVAIPLGSAQCYGSDGIGEPAAASVALGAARRGPC
jgi:hypothetical protein